MRSFGYPPERIAWASLPLCLRSVKGIGPAGPWGARLSDAVAVLLLP